MKTLFINCFYHGLSDTGTAAPNHIRTEKLFIIKIGGNVIDEEQKLLLFLKSFSSIDALKILVHGGGKIATSIGNKLGIQSKYVDGRRITDDATVDLVTMVYGGLINKKIVAQLQALECNALGLTGADGNLIPASKRPPLAGIDYGWAGDIANQAVNAERINRLLEAGFVPVFAPLTHDGQGNVLNTNADTIASALAVTLSHYFDVRLIYCFEKKGVLENTEDEASVIRAINKDQYLEFVAAKKIFAGILPKLDNAFAAIDAGVNEVLIGDAADLIQNTTAGTVGTLITR